VPELVGPRRLIHRLPDDRRNPGARLGAGESAGGSRSERSRCSRAPGALDHAPRGALRQLPGEAAHWFRRRSHLERDCAGRRLEPAPSEHELCRASSHGPSTLRGSSSVFCATGPIDSNPRQLSHRPVCVHAIACRLHPDLPRRSIRASRVTSATARSRASVSWARRGNCFHLVQARAELAAQGIHRWDQLGDWLTASSTAAIEEASLPASELTISHVADDPGVYHFRSFERRRASMSARQPAYESGCRPLHCKAPRRPNARSRC